MVWLGRDSEVGEAYRQCSVWTYGYGFKLGLAFAGSP